MAEPGCRPWLVQATGCRDHSAARVARRIAQRLGVKSDGPCRARTGGRLLDHKMPVPRASLLWLRSRSASTRGSRATTVNSVTTGAPI
jgi:hypothetical protein